VTGTGLTDDPLVATGGGITELDLDLLFDVEVARSLTAAAAPPAADVPNLVPAPAVDAVG
jgi:hypothetical protein